MLPNLTQAQERKDNSYFELFDTKHFELKNNVKKDIKIKENLKK